MEMDYNLKILANFFNFFLGMLKKLLKTDLWIVLHWRIIIIIINLYSAFYITFKSAYNIKTKNLVKINKI